MRVSDLTKQLASITHWSEAEIDLYARKLIDVGILPKARGRAVPDVEVDQVATLLITLCSSQKPSEAPIASRTFGDDLVNQDGDSLKIWLASDLADPSGRIAGLESMKVCRSTPRAELVYKNNNNLKLVIFETAPPLERHLTEITATITGCVLEQIAIDLAELDGDDEWTDEVGR